MLQPLMMLSGIGILCWLMLRGRMKGRRKTHGTINEKTLQHNANRSEVPNQFTGTASAGAPGEVLRWQVELHDLARELKAELDSKLIAVRTVTRSYDNAKSQLSELLRTANALGTAPDSPFARVQALTESGWTSEKIAHVLGMSVADVQTIQQIDRCKPAPADD